MINLIKIVEHIQSLPIKHFAIDYSDRKLSIALTYEDGTTFSRCWQVNTEDDILNDLRDGERNLEDKIVEMLDNYDRPIIMKHLAKCLKVKEGEIASILTQLINKKKVVAYNDEDAVYYKLVK